ncbi:MAG: glycosyltransferase [Bacteroidetes bacterium]|nr:glycosyltransferase [Bacteroidota bacterium]
MKKILAISIVAIGIIALSYTIIASDSEIRSNENQASEIELKTNMRKLWEDHIMWTRNVIFNIMDDLPGKDEAINRLLKNQDHIGNVIKPYYGESAGKALTDLLYVHAKTAADLLTAKKNDNDKAFKEANDKWLSNADEISAFLSNANPNWKLEDMKMMMHDHLKLTTDEAMARKDKNYDADVVAYDKVHDEILEMSDMLSIGIMKQFPEKFKSTNTIGKK